MTLSLYIARKLLIYVALVGAGFGIILMLLDLIEELHRAAGSSITFGQAAVLAALNAPDGLYRILPLVTMLAAIALFVGLARTSELVVIRAAGRSALRMLVAPVGAALILGIFAVAVLNPMVATSSDAYDTLQTHYDAQASGSTLSVTREGVWLRQASPEGQTVIRAAQASLDGTRLTDATFLSLDTKGQPLSRVDAKTAALADGAWQLTDAKVWHFARTANPEAGARTEAQMQLGSDLTRDRIRDSFGDPSRIPIWQLPEFIDQMARAGFSAREHRVWLQMELALPLLLAAMVLIGAGFTIRHVRFGNTGILVLAALISGFSIYFLRNFAQALGNSGQIPVALAAWGPPLAAIFLALGLLLHLEDG